MVETEILQGRAYVAVESTEKPIRREGRERKGFEE